MTDTLTTEIAAFVQNVVDAMGIALKATVEQSPEGARINLEGEDGGVLIRRGRDGQQACTGDRDAGQHERRATAEPARGAAVAPQPDGERHREPCRGIHEHDGANQRRRVRDPVEQYRHIRRGRRARQPHADLGQAERDEEGKRCARESPHAAIVSISCSTRTAAVVVPSTSESATIGTGVVRTASRAGAIVTLR